MKDDRVEHWSWRMQVKNEMKQKISTQFKLKLNSHILFNVFENFKNPIRTKCRLFFFTDFC